MAITSEEIKQVILKEDDFGFEMRVGHALAKLREERQKDIWNTTHIDPPSHGGTYTDAITGKPRQFDYRCRLVRSEPSASARCALLAIECKNIYEPLPLVICGRSRTDAESYYCVIETVYSDKTTNVSTFTRKVSSGQLYRSDEFVGKSLIRLKEKKDSRGATTLGCDANSDIYDRWSQALASSVELAELASRFPNAKISRFFTVVLPIVVVPDNTLWTVMYDDTGSIRQEPKAVDKCEFFVDRKLSLDGKSFVLTHVHFVTLKGLSDLLSIFWNHSSSWDWLVSTSGQALI